MEEKAHTYNPIIADSAARSHRPAYKWVIPSVRPSVRLFVRPSVRLFVRPSVGPSVCPSVRLSATR